MKAKIATVLTLYLLSVSASPARQSKTDRTQIELNLYYRHAGWTMTQPTPDDTRSNNPVLTYSVFRSIVQAVDPQSGEPYDNSVPPPPCSAADLRMRFRLEKKTFLLGEPILVEFRVELDGPGHFPWSSGGNSRARGRDDTFSFVMVSEDGSVVPDPYGKDELSLGGLVGFHDVKRGSPFSEWFPLQRWCAIDQPGAYDLYCISGRYHQETTGEKAAEIAALPDRFKREVYIDKTGELRDVATGAPSTRYELVLRPQTLDYYDSPMQKVFPADVPALAGLSDVGSYAHFKITIAAGTRGENERMVADRARDVEPISARLVNSESRRDAEFAGIWFVRQSLFVPDIAKWLSDPELSGKTYLDALAMRPDGAGLQLLLLSKPDQASAAFYRLNRAMVPDAIPICIEWLSNSDNRVRSNAEAYLIKWTGQSFGHSWTGYDYQRPTLVEGRNMQTLWREWWNQNKDAFVPSQY